jgi:hypothetical protein
MLQPKRPGVIGSYRTEMSAVENFIGWLRLKFGGCGALSEVSIAKTLILVPIQRYAPGPTRNQVGGFYSLDLVLFEYVVALKQRMDLPRRRFAIE